MRRDVDDAVQECEGKWCRFREAPCCQQDYRNMINTGCDSGNATGALFNMLIIMFKNTFRFCCRSMLCFAFTYLDPAFKTSLRTKNFRRILVLENISEVPALPLSYGWLIKMLRDSQKRKQPKQDTDWSRGNTFDMVYDRSEKTNTSSALYKFCVTSHHPGSLWLFLFVCVS